MRLWYTYSIPSSSSNRWYIYTELSELLVLLVMMVMMMMVVVVVVVVVVYACVRACEIQELAERWKADSSFSHWQNWCIATVPPLNRRTLTVRLHAPLFASWPASRRGLRGLSLHDENASAKMCSSSGGLHLQVGITGWPADLRLEVV